MKTEFKAKFLQHFAQKCSREKGFTLIELLVVIIIIGILAAIALPSFLNQATKARQAEAKQNIGSMNRAQTAYMIENEIFAATLSDLGLGIQTQTVHYRYSISPVEGIIGNNATLTINNQSVSLNANLRSYAGGVALGFVATDDHTEAVVLTVLCETRQASKQPALDQILQSNIVLSQCQSDPSGGAYRLMNGR
ncbi:hypothetical protein BST81_08420 [Leptolyngbya sp. 'hensonii']|uniref:type IV pilin-like G/H family protein n=1 Tax=Leptolyngbya sp. 'hensonii' TaxID=1922337 RepID=UPI00094FBC40|nr:type IV pilin-like G/H family protein [Leptolyngbya sp. 'hensonii']OLP18927.1 hypothetical protein BST81_08420 [Leptolyngbya sp. 'hensonii']